ncbi:Rpn family recombination-promoting nuclease/putative transposase [Cupriavidus gilardii]|uniref:Rpn family recombination-promoting nuclease/putative transposase n=1 Tax=Cupriavidus gilardii TaxID=82541 RepID=A0ABY4VQ65_9BURK|nr:Rpn family recombination-promoting nuclease/putative transposase [Cupriavidus gilardii]QQE07456.1 Rpn family recombination-promoting nuclease/putative transposase [Cupriavidus sp. ISTL7]USE79405.1 Rpn family recombination-promoting nuclease/putative transposase [Cupriavidus gilardii]UXC35311.1 Rpn family recombination-promoting nuclease/putative transposase [Cupriavidus gilardii]
MVLTYDSCYKLLFSTPDLVRELVTAFVENDWLRSLDFETLEKIPSQYVGDNLRQRANDVVWRVRADDDRLYLYMPIEFQSTVDPCMAVRVMEYMGLLYQDLGRRKNVLADRKLPPVLPLVMYTGKAPWTAPTDMASMVVAAPRLAARFQPQLAYLLIDTSQYRDSDLQALNNRVAMVILIERGDLDRLPELVDQLNEMIDGDVELHRIFSIWMRQLLHRRSDGVLLLPEVVNLKEVNMSLVLSLNELRQKGVLQGKVEGEAYVLQKVLTQRFGSLPPDIASRIARANTEQLERWVDRLDSAQCLDDIFSDHTEGRVAA